MMLASTRDTTQIKQQQSQKVVPRGIVSKQPTLRQPVVKQYAPNTYETPSKQEEDTTNIGRCGPDQFVAHQLLGTGSFGEVYLVEKISNKKLYAMKILTKSKIRSQNLIK